MSRRPQAVPLLLALVLASLVACSRPAAVPTGPPPLETTDVLAAPDAAADLSADAVGRPPKSGGEAVAGVLPSDFPAAFPLPAGLSLVDFGSDANTRFVVLRHPEGARGLRAQLERQLRAAGFALTPSGDALTAERRGVRVTCTVTAVGSASELRVDYPPNG